MLEAIITLLNTDATLTSLIGENHIYPNPTDYLGTCIVYDYYTFSYDKCKKQARIELNVIAPTIAETLAIENAINNIFVTMGDSPINNTILKVQANGGGSLYDYARKMNHRILRYDIIGR